MMRLEHWVPGGVKQLLKGDGRRVLQLFQCLPHTLGEGLLASDVGGNNVLPDHEYVYSTPGTWSPEGRGAYGDLLHHVWPTLKQHL